MFKKGDIVQHTSFGTLMVIATQPNGKVTTKAFDGTICGLWEKDLKLLYAGDGTTCCFNFVKALNKLALYDE